MTVAALPSVVSYVEDGATVAFPVPYRFQSSGLIVERIVDGVAFPLSSGVDYSVSGGDTDQGGTLTRTVASDGATLRIRRSTVLAQDMSYTTGDRFPANSHEAALDQQTMGLQDTQRDASEGLARALQLPIGEAASDLPPAALRRDTVLGFDPVTGEQTLLKTGSFPPGPPGGAGNVVQSIGQLRATIVSSGTMIAAYDRSGSSMTWTEGDFTALAAARPLDYVESDFHPLTVGAWVRQLASGIQTPDGNLQDVLDERRPVTVQLYRYAIETTDDGAWLRARAAVIAAGGGTIQIPARTILLTKTAFVPSAVTVEGMGDASHVVFTGEDPTAIVGSPASPRWGNIRTAAFAIVGTNPDDMAPGAYSDGHTGDYATTDLRAFAAATTLLPGATQMTVADATGLAPGGFVWLEAGWIGWHSALHEMLQIAAIAGNVVTFTSPVRHRYSNAPGDAFTDFIDRFAYGGDGPPAVVGFGTWRQAGYRRVVPVQNARIRNLTITNPTKHENYANLAVAIVRGFRCALENVRVHGGGVWNIDSDGSEFVNLSLDRFSAAYPQTDFLPANGANGCIVSGLFQKGGGLYLEEGGCDLMVQGRTFGQVFVNQFCRDIRLDLSVTQDQNYALRIEKSAQVQAAGRYLSAQPAIQYGTRDFFTLYPGATLAHWKAIGEHFDGANFRVMPGSFAYSPLNNSLDLAGEQPFVADGVEVGGAFGDFFDVAAGSPGYAIGSLRRRQDQARVGSPRVAARPTFYPRALSQTVYDTSADRAWSVVNVAIKTIANVPSSTTFTANAITSMGSVKAGDIVRVLIENTAVVTGADGQTYQSGTARAWHFSTVSAADTATGLVTIATAVPNNWQAKIGADGAAYFARWG